MKFRLVPILLGVFGVAVLVPEFAGAQMPFNSTSPPSPFNRPTGLPSNTPAPRNNNLLQPQVMPGGVVPSNYPSGTYMPGAAGATSSSADPDHKLGRGDQLSYRVVEDRDDKVYPLVVTDSGEVELPLGGRVKATGKSTQQLTSDIKSTLEREYYYHATVQLGLNFVAQGTSRGKVYFNGELNSKGALDLPVDGQLTLSQAILQLGGFTIEANQKKVVIIRKGGPPKGIVVDVKAVLRGDTDKDIILQPGDQVTVPKSLFNIQM